MKALWARLTGRVHADEEKRAEALLQMTPEERLYAEEPPQERALDAKIESRFGEAESRSDPEDPERLLTGPGS